MIVEKVGEDNEGEVDEENKVDDNLNENLVLLPLEDGTNMNPPATPLGKKVVTNGYRRAQ